MHHRVEAEGHAAEIWVGEGRAFPGVQWLPPLAPLTTGYSFRRLAAAFLRGLGVRWRGGAVVVLFAPPARGGGGGGGGTSRVLLASAFRLFPLERSRRV